MTTVRIVRDGRAYGAEHIQFRRKDRKPAHSMFLWPHPHRRRPRWQGHDRPHRLRPRCGGVLALPHCRPSPCPLTQFTWRRTATLTPKTSRRRRATPQERYAGVNCRSTRREISHRQRLSPRVAALLLDNLPAIERPLIDGSIAVLEDGRIRLRSLPLGNERSLDIFSYYAYIPIESSERAACSLTSEYRGWRPRVRTTGTFLRICAPLEARHRTKSMTCRISLLHNTRTNKVQTASNKV